MEKDILWTNRYFMIYFEYVMYVEYQGLCGVSVCFISIGFCFFFQDRDLHPELSWSGIRGSHSKKVAGSKGNKGICESSKNTLHGSKHMPQKWHFEDDFPFPQVGYVNSLEGILFFQVFLETSWICPKLFCGMFPGTEIKIEDFLETHSSSSGKWRLFKIPKQPNRPTSSSRPEIARLISIRLETPRQPACFRCLKKDATLGFQAH